MTSENQKRKRRARSAAAKKVKKQRCQANEAIPQMADATMARLQAQQPMLITAYDVCHNKLQAERLHRILAQRWTLPRIQHPARPQVRGRVQPTGASKCTSDGPHGTCWHASNGIPQFHHVLTGSRRFPSEGLSTEVS